MRTLGPKEVEGLGPESQIWEAYKFGISEALKTSGMSKETMPKISKEHQADRGQQGMFAKGCARRRLVSTPKINCLCFEILA